jgi:hypothetical protein
MDRTRAPRRPGKVLVLDINSSVSPTYGEQEDTAYNGSAPATTRCPSSTRTATWSDARCGRARAQHPRLARRPRPGGGAVSRAVICGACCAAMRPSHCPEVYEYLEAEGFGDRSACPPPRCSRIRSPTCSRARWPATALRPALRRELPLPGAELEPAASSGGEGGVASRRAVPACRLHRDEPAPPGQAGGRLLQRARDGGAVDQGRQERGQ